MDDEDIAELGTHPETGAPISFVRSKTQVAMAKLREAGIPLYDVDALQEAANDQRRQASDLRAKASELEKKAGEFDGLVSICGRRDMELALKGMKLENGRVVFIDGDLIRQG